MTSRQSRWRHDNRQVRVNIDATLVAIFRIEKVQYPMILCPGPGSPEVELLLTLVTTAGKFNKDTIFWISWWACLLAWWIYSVWTADLLFLFFYLLVTKLKIDGFTKQIWFFCWIRHPADHGTYSPICWERVSTVRNFLISTLHMDQRRSQYLHKWSYDPIQSENRSEMVYKYDRRLCWHVCHCRRHCLLMCTDMPLLLQEMGHVTSAHLADRICFWNVYWVQ